MYRELQNKVAMRFNQFLFCFHVYVSIRVNLVQFGLYTFPDIFGVRLPSAY